MSTSSNSSVVEHLHGTERTRVRFPLLAPALQAFEVKHQFCKLDNGVQILSEDALEVHQDERPFRKGEVVSSNLTFSSSFW